MVSAYLVSLEARSGKTLVCLALGVHYQEKGAKVKYMKPLSSTTMVKNRAVSYDALLVKEKLGLKESLELLTPVLVHMQNWEETILQPAERIGGNEGRTSAELLPAST